VSPAFKGEHPWRKSRGTVLANHHQTASATASESMATRRWGATGAASGARTDDGADPQRRGRGTPRTGPLLGFPRVGTPLAASWDLPTRWRLPQPERGTVEGRSPGTQDGHARGVRALLAASRYTIASWAWVHPCHWSSEARRDREAGRRVRMLSVPTGAAAAFPGVIRKRSSQTGSIVAPRHADRPSRIDGRPARRHPAVGAHGVRPDVSPRRGKSSTHGADRTGR
jgi:hypothetical protein